MYIQIPSQSLPLVALGSSANLYAFTMSLTRLILPFSNLMTDTEVLLGMNAVQGKEGHAHGLIGIFASLGNCVLPRFVLWSRMWGK